MEKEHIVLACYRVTWNDISTNSFIATIAHFRINEAGGSLETQVGVLVGYKTVHPEFWNIKLILRNCILFEEQANSTVVVVKSAYRSKARFYLDKFTMWRKRLSVHKNFEGALLQLLLTEGLCDEPRCLYTSVEKEMSYLSRGGLTLDDLD